MLMVFGRVVGSFQELENVACPAGDFIKGDFDLVFRIFRELTFQSISEFLVADLSNS
jgi:hypothetical protein